jgi:uncharacterized membrane protein YecN with MAPEG domain
MIVAGQRRSVDMTAIGIVAVYAALNALLILLLAFNVGQNRARSDALAPGAVGDAKTVRAIRAHGNATEFIPLAIIVLLILALMQASSWLLHALGGAFTVGRVLQALGMLRERHPNALRFVGNLLTGLVYLASAVSCLLYALA